MKQYKKRAATAAAAAWSLINRSMQTYLLLLCYLIDLDQPKTLWQREEEEKKIFFFFCILRREMDCLSTAFQGGIFLINAYFNVLIYEPLFWPWTRGKLESCLGQIMEMLPQRNTSQMYPRYDNSALNCFNGHLRTAPKQASLCYEPIQNNTPRMCPLGQCMDGLHRPLSQRDIRSN